MKTLRYAFWAIVALILILVGMANRGMVTLRAMPTAFSDFLGISPDIQMPLFVAIFIGVGVGLCLASFGNGSANTKNAQRAVQRPVKLRHCAASWRVSSP